MSERDRERAPAPERRDTAPIEPLDRPAPRAGWSPVAGDPAHGWREQPSGRRHPETAELLPSVPSVHRIAAPLGLDDDIEADGPAERTLGFEDPVATLDELQQEELRAAVARSLAVDLEALGESGLLAPDRDDPHTTADFDADTTRRYRDVLLGGADATADFGDSLDASLDLALDGAPLEESPTEIEAPRADTRPLGGMTATEWASHVLTACRALAAVHEAGSTFGGRFDLDESGVIGEARPAQPGGEGAALDLRRMGHLISVIAEAVRAGSDHGSASMVVVDALAEIKPASSADALTRALRRALEARAVRQHKRLVAELEAIDARQRALTTQRRLRADLAARLARLDASISAQASAVARDADRGAALAAERAALDALTALVGTDPPEQASAPADEAAAAGDQQSSAGDARGDAVRRLIGA